MVNASLHWLRYSRAYTSSGSYLFMCTAVIVRCHLLAIVWSNSSLMRFALIDMFVSHFSENCDHLFTQDLDWYWPEDLLRVMHFQSLPIVNGVTDAANFSALV